MDGEADGGEVDVVRSATVGGTDADPPGGSGAELALRRHHGGPTTGVFTDGACEGNPGPGWWAAARVADDRLLGRLGGGEPETTNNRMELTALLAGYRLVPDGEPAVIYTDSRLAVDTITKWADAWAARGWRRRAGPVANLDLVEPLHRIAKARPEVELRWIKAHDGARWNEYVDRLATGWARAAAG